jgi:hypothetical protein
MKKLSGIIGISFILLATSALAGETLVSSTKLDRVASNPSRQHFAVKRQMASACGPVNCCLNAACARQYQSQWVPELGRCAGCASR